MRHPTQQQQQQQQRRSERNIVRLVVISDTHMRHKALHDLLPSPDPNMRTLLLHCGDFSDRGSLQGVRSFCRWLARTNDETAMGTEGQRRLPLGLPAHYDEVVVIDGNHDHARPPLPSIDLHAEFEKWNRVLQQKQIHRRVHFLQDRAVTVAGVTIHGVSWRSIAADDFSAIIDHHNSGRLPDVVLSHIPPHLPRRQWAQVQPLPGTPLDAWMKGSPAFAQVVLSHQIPLVLSGHLHWGRGAIHVVTDDTPRGCGDNSINHNHNTATWLVNASSTKPGVKSPTGESDLELEVTAPVVIDYDSRNRQVVRLYCPPH